MTKKRKTPSTVAALRKKSDSSASAGGKAFSAAVRLLVLPKLAPEEPYWRHVWLFLSLAFVLRAAVALAGDFVIHPDEIMQYLEPAHSLVFGNGVHYWEYYYGARSWLLPGFIAGVLWVCQLLGLDQPAHYIAAVKTSFCLLSVIIPYSMYVVGRNLFGETSGRVGLVLGAFWYELVGFAHKPMTEFTATILIFLLLALVVRPPARSLSRPVIAVGVGVLVAAVRFHYLPVVGLVLLAEFLRVDGRTRVAMIVAAAAGVLVVGLFEIATWGGFLRSYWVNLKVNLLLSTGRGDESSPLHFIFWLCLASGGLFLLAAAGAGRWHRRKFLIVLTAAVLLPHMWEAHREYRFIFLTIPLWLMLLADALATGILDPQKGRGLSVGGVAYAAVISVFGIANAIPYQGNIYVANSQETGVVHFLSNQDDIFDAYRRVAANPSVSGVWDSQRAYFNGGGYYYLHHRIPFYDISNWREQFTIAQVSDHVSHIIAGSPVEMEGFVQDERGRPLMKISTGYLPLPFLIYDDDSGRLVYWNEGAQATVLNGFELAENLGNLSLWRRTDTEASTRQWKNYTVTPDSRAMYPIISRAIPGIRKPPNKTEFVDP